MPPIPIDDWASGISRPLRKLAFDGADDQELEQFVHARKRGDSDEAARILNTPRMPPAPRPVSEIGAELDEVLYRVRITALRQVVNDIDVRLLQRYMEVVWHVSEQVVTALKQEPFWSIDRAVIAVGNVVAKSALDQINSSAS